MSLSAPAPPSTRHGRQSLVIGTRNSVLAMAQMHIVQQYLLDHFPGTAVAVSSLKTSGDINISQALYEIARKALWTEELEQLLCARMVDLIVHSLKDMPTQLPPRCRIGAILKRADPRDALVVRAGSNHTSLSTLVPGSVVGTSSIRRIAQIRRHYPHLTIKDMRGNVLSRISKLDDPENGYDALVLAAAGLARLGIEDRIVHYFEAPEMLHAVGQGAIAVEVREDDDELMAMLQGLHHPKTERACLAERALLRALEGGCSVPIGVETSWRGEKLLMKALVASTDGKRVIETEMVAEPDDDPDDFGKRVARVLIDLGASPILKEIEAKRQSRAAEGEEDGKGEEAAPGVSAVSC